MATFATRNGQITATVRIKPMPSRSKTFSDMAKAKAWAFRTESNLRTLRERAAPLGKVVSRAMPTTPGEVLALKRHRADAFAGVYFLFFEGECVYVGKSKNVFWRARSHEPSFKFDSFSWAPCKLEDLDFYERFFIKLMNPTRNIVGKDRVVQAVVHSATTDA